MKHDNTFPPDTIDEQVERVLSALPDESSPPESKVIDRLSALYKADQHAIERVWKRLAQRLAEYDTPVQPIPLSTRTIHGSREERKPALHPQARAARRAGSSRFTKVAAAVLVILLVSSLLLVFRLAQASRTAAPPHQTTQTASPPGLYITQSDGVSRLNAQTRQVIWQAPISEQSLPHPAGPVVIGDTVYITANRTISALDAQTGALRWSHDFPQTVVPPSMDDGLLYISSSPLLGKILYVVNPATGMITATYTPHQGQKIWIFPPLVVDGVLYYVDLASSSLSAVHLLGEKLLWQHQLSKPLGNWEIFAQNGVVYVRIGKNSSSNKGLIEAFDARSGSKLWQSPTIANGVRTVTITKDMIYMASSGALLAFDTHTHALLWQKKLNIFDMQVASGILYIDYIPGTSSDEHESFAALSAASGTLLWQRNNDSNGGGGGVEIVGVSSGVFYGVGWTNDGKKGTIYALDASKGVQLWTMPTGAAFGGMAVV